MKFIHQSQLDKQNWDKFVDENGQDIFQYSWYLDSCAPDWCVLVDDKWENGIALPFNKHLGIENLSAVIFGRTLDFIGDDVAFQNKALEAIKTRFKAGKIHMQHQLTADQVKILTQNPPLEKVHQIIETEFKLGSQAKRMLKKAEKEGILIREASDWKSIIEIAENELSDKISEFNELNLNRLRKLTQALSAADKLICLGIYEADKLTGGMLFIKTATANLYLKGSAFPDTKKHGGMYLCMNTFISQTIADNKTFDFGGSSVEGVQRFNYNLGGKDKTYFVYEWNRTPWWYQVAKNTYHLMKKIKN